MLKTLNHSRLVCLTTLMLLATLGTTKAQLGIGPVVSVNVTEPVYIDDQSAFAQNWETDYQFGYAAGLAFHHEMFSIFSFQSELTYGRRGKRITTNSLDEGNATHTANYQFVDLTGLMRLSFGSEPIWYYVSMGPRLSAWTGGSGTYESAPLLEVEIEKLDYNVVFQKDQLNNLETYYPGQANRVQVSFIVGVGVMFSSLPNQRSQIEVRYEIGASEFGPGLTGRFGADQFIPNEDLNFRLQTLSVAYTHYFNFSLVPKKGKIKATRSK